jgi:arsenite-transporting ATPase
MISTKWWVINSSLYQTGTSNKLLVAKASNETKWINKVDVHSKGNFALISWSPEEIKGDLLLRL